MAEISPCYSAGVVSVTASSHIQRPTISTLEVGLIDLVILQQFGCGAMELGSIEMWAQI
jgi:hypothetical protein